MVYLPTCMVDVYGKFTRYLIISYIAILWETSTSSKKEKENHLNSKL